MIRSRNLECRQPDLKDYALAAFEPVEVATSKVSLSDLLNPAPEDHSADTSSINTWGSEPDDTSLDEQQSVDVTAAETSSCYSYAKSAGSDVSFNGAPSAKEMFVDSSSAYSDAQSDKSPASESGSEVPSDARMDVDDVGIGSLPEKKSATLLSFFKRKTGIDKSDKPTKNVVTALKRRRTSSDSCESDSESDNYRRRAGKLRKSEGKSRSAKASLANREKARRGELEIDEEKYEVWKEKVLETDPNAEFDRSNLRAARHSACGRTVLMKDRYDATRWRAYVKKCEKDLKFRNKKASAGMTTLGKMGWKKTSDNSKTAGQKQPEKTQPCPGITEEDNGNVPKYLRRTGVLGGGARSITIIALERFGKMFSKLGKKTKKEVVDTQIHEWKWRNDHANMRVFSTKCKHTVLDRAPERLLPCTACNTVLRSKGFKAALRKPVPEDKNFIYTNHRFQDPVLGKIYARSIGLKEIVEAPVRRQHYLIPGCHPSNIYRITCTKDMGSLPALLAPKED
jgi:hypothetical protein